MSVSICSLGGPLEIFSRLSAIGKVLTCAVRKTQHPAEWDTAVPGEGEKSKGCPATGDGQWTQEGWAETTEAKLFLYYHSLYFTGNSKVASSSSSCGKRCLICVRKMTNECVWYMQAANMLMKSTTLYHWWAHWEWSPEPWRSSDRVAGPGS